MLEKPAFIQGFFPFVGAGYEKPVSFRTTAGYAVPPDRRAQAVYFRAGNPSDEMIYVVLMRRENPMRYFPVGAKAAIHIPLAVLEDLPPGSPVELLIGAPRGLESALVLDVGFMEIA